MSGCGSSGLQWPSRLLRYSDIALAGVSFALAALAIARINGEVFPSPDGLSSWTFPAVIAGSLILVGAFLLVRTGLFRAYPSVRWSFKALIVIAAFLGIAALLLSFAGSDLSLKFGPFEFVGLIILIQAIVIALARASRLRTIAMILLGALLATVGIDAATGIARLTFGSNELLYGVPSVPLWLGLLIVADALICLFSPRLALSNYARQVAGWTAPQIALIADIGLRVVALLAIGASCYYAFHLHNSMWDVGALAVFAVLGVACRLFDWNRLALTISFLHGPLLEVNLSRALEVSGGDPLILTQSPGIVMIALAGVILTAAIIVSVRRLVRPSAA
jgi:TctA family transporter